VSAVRHFLEIDDLEPDEGLRVLDLSLAPPRSDLLAGSGAVFLFEKPSARTRTSVEMATSQLGGHPVALLGDEVGIDRRESAEDLARLCSGMGRLLGARVYAHSVLERLAAASAVPVVNLLSDDAHPIQTLADLLTIRREFSSLSGLRVVFVGDANNVARSLAIGCSLVGATFVWSGPPEYGFSVSDRDRIASAGATVVVEPDPRRAVAGADVVYTDTWYSMGQEEEQAARTAVFAPWRVDAELLGLAAERAVFLHCLPAHRGDEATDDVLDGPASRIWSQAHDRLHTARGLFTFLLDPDARREGS
jgi:ornithine carbamoyltransferase